MPNYERQINEFLQLFGRLVDAQARAAVPSWAVGLIGAAVGAALAAALAEVRDRWKHRRELGQLREALYHELTDMFTRMVGMYETLHTNPADPTEGALTQQTWDERADWLKGILDATAYEHARKDPVAFYELPEARTLQILYKTFVRVLDGDSGEQTKLSALMSVSIKTFEREFMENRVDQGLVLKSAQPKMRERLSRLLSGEKKSVVAILDQFAKNQEVAKDAEDPRQPERS